MGLWNSQAGAAREHKQVARAGRQELQRKQKLRHQVYNERVKQQLKLLGPNRTKHRRAGGNEQGQ